MPEREKRYALCSIADVAGVLQKPPQTDHESAIRVHINDVSARFEGPSGVRRRLRSQTYVHDGDVAGGNLPLLTATFPDRIYLRNAPITSVAVLKVLPNASALTESTDGGTTGDFLVHHEAGQIELLAGSFYRGRPATVCTYTAGFVDEGAAGFSESQLDAWGWDRAAADVRLAVARQVAHEYRLWSRGYDGVASISEGTSTVTLTQQPWLPEVKEVIKAYKLAGAP